MGYLALALWVLGGIMLRVMILMVAAQTRPEDDFVVPGPTKLALVLVLWPVNTAIGVGRGLWGARSKLFGRHPGGGSVLGR